MIDKKLFGSGAVVLIALLIMGLYFLGQNQLSANPLLPVPVSPSQPSELPVQVPPPPPTVAQNVPTTTFPVSANPINVSVEGVKGLKNVKISWTDTKWQPFYVVLFEFRPDNSTVPWWVVYGASSIKQGEGALPVGGHIITTQDIADSLPSGYVLGEATTGFKQSLMSASSIELSIGTEYMLQVDGFDKNGKIVVVNKQFNFTPSCLAPGCQ